MARVSSWAHSTATDAGTTLDVELIPGSWDLPGARLLDVVATMDRLRSPGGCPWDANQTHDSLAPFHLTPQGQAAIAAVVKQSLQSP